MSDLFFPLGDPYHIAYRKDSPASPVGPHAHDGAEVYFTLTPLPDVLVGNRLLSVPAGSVILIPPFCVHQLYHAADVRYERYVMSIQSSWISAVLREHTPALFRHQTGEMPRVFSLSAGAKKELTESFRKLLSFSDPMSPAALGTFFSLLDLLQGLGNEPLRAGQKGPDSPSMRRVNDMIAYIGEHVRENIGVSEIAGHYHLNPDHLSRLFKEHAHMPLGRYITLQRIAYAQQLLREGHTVNEVAEEMNFSGYAYFFKTFQKITGISPSRYRARYSRESGGTPS